MTEKRALILCVTGVTLLNLLLLSLLKSLDMSNEDLVLAYLLVLIGGAFGVGQIVMHYQR
jgi:hypothetical protein